MLEIKLLRTFGPKREEATGKCKILIVERFIIPTV
jgi:hypothetical protein